MINREVISSAHFALPSSLSFMTELYGA